MPSESGPGIVRQPIDVVSGNHLVLYRVSADAVEIVRVLHGARDLGGLAYRVQGRRGAGD